MASSIGGSSSQSTNAGANQSTVTGTGSITITVGNFSGMQSHGRVTIGGNNYDIDGPTAMSAGQSWSWSASRTYDHDTNGYRGPVDVSVSFWVDGTNFHANSTGAGTQGAIDYDRRPATPGSVSAVVNSDKSVTVTVAGVSSPAGTPTYYCSYSQNGGAYTGTLSSTSNVFTFSGLQRGANFTFAGWASNSDGVSGTTYSPSYFLSAGGKINVGSGFVSLNNAKINFGSGWVDMSTAKINFGSGWTNIL